MDPADRPSAPASEFSWTSAFDPRQNLATRAALIVVVAGTFFVSAASWVAGARLQQKLTQRRGAELEALAFHLGDKLDRIIFEQARGLIFAGTLTPLRDPTTPAPDRRRLLEALLDSSPDLVWVGFVSADAKVVSATGGRRETESVSTQAWFNGARTQAFFGEPREVPELARDYPLAGETPRFVTISAPVTSAEGRFLGVLAAEWNWAAARGNMASVLTEAARRDRVSITLYNLRGEPILDSSPANASAPPGPPPIGNRRPLRAAMREIIPGEGDFMTGLATTRGFRGLRGINALVAARQPMTDIFDAATDLRNTLLQWGLALALAFGLATRWTVARLTRRLRAVATAADRIRAGDILTLMPQPPGEGEVARMGRALDAMVQDFRSKQKQLSAEKLQPEIMPESRLKPADRDISKYI